MGTPGSIGSLLTIEKGSSSNKLQQWVVSDKLPDGKTVEGYKQLAHTIKGIERCLETSGDEKYKKVIARNCKASSNYQSYALTEAGEIRQMGRCLTTDKSHTSYGDGFQLDLAECQNDETQKWNIANNGWIFQKLVPNSSSITNAALSALGADKQYANASKKIKATADPSASASTPMCITEGQVFNSSDSMPFLTKEQKTAMNGVASFGLIGIESCAVTMKNSKSNSCMHVNSDGQLEIAKCNQSKALDNNQAFGVSGGKLVQHSYSDKKFHIKKVWIDTARNEHVPATSVTPDLKAAGNNASKAIQNLMKDHKKSGFAFDGKKHVFQYNKDVKKCIAAPDGKDKLSSNDKKKLKSQLQKLQLQQQKLMMPPPTKKKQQKLQELQKQQSDINAKLVADAQSNWLKGQKCSSSSYEKWTPIPISSTTWKIK